MASSLATTHAHFVRNASKATRHLLASHLACQARLMSTTPKYDVAVVGGGPGGYVAAIKAAQLGLKTVCIEKRGSLGGTCLNVGCIPSKSLLNISHKFHEASTDFAKMGISFGSNNAKPMISVEKMLKQKEKSVKGLTGGIEGLFKKNKIEYLKGTASLTGINSIQVSPTSDKTEAVEVTAKNIILATGSESSPMPGNVIKADEKVVVTSTGALSMKSVPKKMCIVGAGVIGLELGSVWRRLGAQVEVVEYMDTITPALDVDMRKSLQKALEKQGFKFHLSSKVTGADIRKDGATVNYENQKGKHQANCDVVLLSVGRRPFTDGLGVESLGIEKDKMGRIVVDDYFRVSSCPTIFAIGDIIRGPMLAHKAEDEGMAVAAYLGGEVAAPHVNYEAIPNVVYTHPEVAGVGKTEDELIASQKKFAKTTFPFMANSRARTNDDAEGLVKLLVDPCSKKILGAWIFGPQAGELIAELTLAIEMGITVRDIAKTCHAHPTLSEAVKEACIALSVGKPIHM